MSVVLIDRRLTYELGSLLSTFLSDFQQHLEKNKDNLTVEEV